MLKIAPLRSLLVVLACLPNSGCVTKSITLDTEPPADITVHSWQDTRGLGKQIGQTPIQIPSDQVSGQVLKMAVPGKASQFLAFIPESQGSIELRLKLFDEIVERQAPQPAPANQPQRQGTCPPCPQTVCPQQSTPLAVVPGGRNSLSAVCPASVPCPQCQECTGNTKVVYRDKLDYDAVNEMNRQVLEAVQAYRDGDLNRVQLISNRIAQQHPELALPHLLMGLAAMHDGKMNAAKTAFTKAADLDQGDQKIRALLRDLR